jgi:Ca2+:H+ antiporter
LTDLFVGMVVVAIVGNAAEHWSAVVIARAGNMQLAMNIPKSSSVQIALMVAPLLILFSWVLGTPMSLVFHPFELFGIALAVGAAGLVSLDGQTHWFEGVLLLGVYALLAIAVFFVPG